MSNRNYRVEFELEIKEGLLEDIEIRTDMAIITVVGQDTVGIIARVCTYLSEKTVNVLDISQTIIDGYFNMMMIVDYSEAKDDFETIVSDLEAMSSEIGVQIRCQREEIFTSMHRV